MHRSVAHRGRVPILWGDDFFGLGSKIHVAAVQENGPPMDWHAHDFLEIAMVRRGTAIHRVGAFGYPVATGDLFVIHRFEPHAFTDAEELEVTYLLLGHTELAQLKARLNNIPGAGELFSPDLTIHRQSRQVRLPKEETQQVQQLLDTMHRERSGVASGKNIMLECLLIQMMVIVGRQYTNDAQKNNGSDRPKPCPAEPPPSHTHLRAAGRLIRYIENHYAEDLRVPQLAEHVGLQPQYLARVFKQAVGTTPTGYLRRFRVRRACELLAHSDRSVTTICFQTGFNDLSHFVRVFHRAVGCAPGAWRRKVRNGQGKVTPVQLPAPHPN